MIILKELALLKNKSLTETELHLNNLSCFNNKAICRIFAIKHLHGNNIYYGVDENSRIFFGPLELWSPLGYNYRILMDFVKREKDITYSKVSLKHKLKEYLLSCPDTLSGTIL